jgi:hypothetical protein
MARRPNYGFEKRQRELRRQKKREEKAERKRLKREAAGGDQDQISAESGGDPEAVDDAPVDEDQETGPGASQ